MLSIEEKKKMVEQGLQQFHVSSEFRACLRWFVDEFDKVYEKALLKKNCDFVNKKSVIKEIINNKKGE